MTKINIGLFGYGVVGQGFYQVLSQGKNKNASIEKICVKHTDKQRNIDSSIFTFDKHSILENERINTVVEVIDDAHEAFLIAREAMEKGKNVVSANKKMIATYLSELVEIQRKTNVSFFYEAAVCGAIPIIRTLDEFFRHDYINQIEGIFNGTTNYILTKIFQENVSYEKALKEAQIAGFAESDPTLDINGMDAKFKLTILIYRAFGAIVHPDNILTLGIQFLNEQDVAFARNHRYTIKLVAKVILHDDKIYAFVMPSFIETQNLLYFVNNEYNAVSISSTFSGHQFYIGKGAGSLPTGSAVFSDINTLTRSGNFSENVTNQPNNSASFSNEFEAKIYFRTREEVLKNQLLKENFSELSSNNGTHQLIGTISLKKLESFNLENRPDSFVAILP